MHQCQINASHSTWHSHTGGSERHSPVVWRTEGSSAEGQDCLWVVVPTTMTLYELYCRWWWWRRRRRLDISELQTLKVHSVGTRQQCVINILHRFFWLQETFHRLTFNGEWKLLKGKTAQITGLLNFGPYLCLILTLDTAARMASKSDFRKWSRRVAGDLGTTTDGADRDSRQSTTQARLGYK